MLHVVLHVCCMCVACVLHVRCMAGVQDRAVTLSKWRACHAERQPVHPTTLRNQVKKVSRLSLHVFHLAQPILAHMRPRKQTDTPTHKQPAKLIPILSLTQCRPHSRVCLQPWVHPIVSFLSPGSSKKTAIPWSTTPQRSCSPRPPIQCCLLNFVFGGLQKKQPFLLMMFGTSDHNIEVGGCGGKQGISVVSCGWLFFLKNLVFLYIYILYLYKIMASCTNINYQNYQKNMSIAEIKPSMIQE